MKKATNLYYILSFILIINFAFSEAKNQNIEDNLKQIRSLANTDIDSALSLAKKTYELANATDSNYISNSAIYLANIYKIINYPDSALFYDKIALQSALLGNDSINIARKYGSLAADFGMLGEIDSSIYYLSKEYELLEKHGDELDKLNNRVDLSINYNKIEYYNKAYEIGSEAMDIANKIKDSTAILTTYINHAVVLTNLDSLNEALELFKIYNASGYKDSLMQVEKALSAINYIYTLVELDKLDEAKVAIDYNRNLIENEDYPISLGSYYTTKAIYYRKLGELPKASEAITKAQEIAAKYSEAKSIRNAAQIAYLIYKDLGDDSKALENLELYKREYDRTSSRERVHAINELAAKYDLELKNHKIEELKKSDELKGRVIEWQRVATTLIICIFGFATWFYLRDRKKKREIIAQNTKIFEQEKELEASKFESIIAKKEKEIYGAAKQLAESHLAVNELSTELEKYKSRKVGSVNLDELVRDLAKSEGNRKKLKDFEYKFREMYPDFYSNLADEVSDLSKTELRICAFLRMNLSSKEISAIINSSPRTIDKHRYNIRRKMGLGAEDNVFDALQKF
jgi:DNA-binding CsgD family transcriptional regulator